MSTTIYVVGSANVDYITRVERIPSVGETVMGEDVLVAFGGKGANQAVAAARLGGHVRFLGSFGSDDAGMRYVEHLESEGVDTSLSVNSERANGCALIAVDHGGGNIIISAPGANQDLQPEHLAGLREQLKPGDVVLLQCEVPMATNVEAAIMAHEIGALLVFNPSPFENFDRLKEEGIGVLVVNEHEAALAIGQDLEEGDLLEALAEMASGMAEAVVVTRGAEPAWLITRDEFEEFPSQPVTPVDTVGAGDTFTGALAVALSEGEALESAVAFAQMAAGRAVLAMGAQAAMPHRAEL